MTKTIPLADPRAGYEAHQAEILAAVQAVLSQGQYILGPEVNRFEEEFSVVSGVQYAVGVASGTDALELSLRILGIGRGDAVLTVSHTAVATAAAIDRCGAVPVFVDIDPETLTMDPDHLLQAIAFLQSSDGKEIGRPGAIMPVHLYGMPANLPAIMKIAEKAGIPVVEDCAQAHGADIRTKPVGSFGNLAAYSFYPTKNLGAFGDGGMIATKDLLFAKSLRRLRQYGWTDRYVSKQKGINSRLDEIQAAILRVRLKYFRENTCRRIQLAEQYRARLADLPLRMPPLSIEGRRHVFHLFVVRTSFRNELKSFLQEEGICTGIHYPVPIHLQPAYRNSVSEKYLPLPVTESICKEILSLPMFPELVVSNVDRICDRICRFFDRRGVRE